VHTWSDFLKADLHPRTVVQLRRFRHGADAFTAWDQGHEAWRAPEVVCIQPIRRDMPPFPLLPPSQASLYGACSFFDGCLSSQPLSSQLAASSLVEYGSMDTSI